MKDVCAICFDSFEQVSSGCGRNDCGQRFCAACLDHWFAIKLEESSKFVLPVPCPGRCGRPVPAKHWCSFVKKGETELRSYEDKARGLLGFRCGSCGNSETLFAEAATESGESRMSHAKLFSQILEEFQEGIVTEAEVVQVFTDMLRANTKMFEESGNMYFRGNSVDQRLQNMLREKVLHLIPDIERRCALHLEALRKHPKIFAPCCGTRFCWNCKAGTHHEGTSCEDYMNGEMAVQCLRCPNCNTPTEKIDCPGSCATVRCACGHRWRPSTCK